MVAKYANQRLVCVNADLTVSCADFVASIAGAVASITVASPLDVVKTRIQNANFNSTVSGGAIVRDMVRTEGVGSFFKGLTPKAGRNSEHLNNAE